LVGFGEQYADMKGLDDVDERNAKVALGRLLSTTQFEVDLNNALEPIRKQHEVDKQRLEPTTELLNRIVR
jgi:hypothetical protein